MTLLFLDIDGVLYPFLERHSGPNHPVKSALRLEAVLADFPDVKVIITSTQRKDESIRDLHTLFGAPELAARVAGVTPEAPIDSLYVLAESRYREIQMYLNEEHPSGARPNWIALDDDETLFPPDCPNLIRCDNGFDERAARRLKKMLANSCRPKAKGSNMLTGPQFLERTAVKRAVDKLEAKGVEPAYINRASQSPQDQEQGN